MRQKKKKHRRSAPYASSHGTNTLASPSTFYGNHTSHSTLYQNHTMEMPDRKAQIANWIPPPYAAHPPAR